MPRRMLAALVALTCTVYMQLAEAAPAETVDAEADALFNEGNYLAAARLLTEALEAVDEALESRTQRNLWATGAINAYKRAFAADPGQCISATAGLAVADEYLRSLVAVYGARVTNADEYSGVQRLRGELEDARLRLRCPGPAAPSALVPAHTGEPERARDRPADVVVSPVESAEPTGVQIKKLPPARAHTRGLAAGLGVSAAAAASMAVLSIVAYTQVRKPSGRFYKEIFEAAKAGGIGIDPQTNMCIAGRDIPAVVAACRDWQALARVYYAAGVLAGISVVSAAVLTGLLIHKRRSLGPNAALLRKYQAQFGAGPYRGGMSLAAGISF